MDGSSGSFNAGSSTWPLFVLLELSAYLCDYATSLDAVAFKRCLPVETIALFIMGSLVLIAKRRYRNG